MGGTYLNEMEKLAQTLEWANDTSLGELADAINKIGGHPFFTVGSGGSLAGAAYWSMVNELMTGQPSKYGTPLELLALPSVSPYAVGLMSAGGGNPDIVQSLAHAARDGSPGQFILTYAKASLLNEEAERHSTAHVISFAPPIPKDGYLATNSLLASMVLVLRGYCAASEIAQLLLSDLPAPRQVDVNPDISTYSLLYAGWGNVAAVDFESKLVEGGVASIHLTDLRNYAHGRYNWLERHGKTTTLVALITPEWAPLLDRTLEHLSPSVEVIRLQASHEGPLGAIELVVEQMRLFGQIAAAHGLDPGNPPAPEFGRELFNLTIGGQ